MVAGRRLRSLRAAPQFLLVAKRVIEQRCNPRGLLRRHWRRLTALTTVRCEAAFDGPSVRVAIGVAQIEELLLDVVLSALFLS